MMGKIALVCRYLMGLIYFVFGLNGFLHFMPNSPMPDAAMEFAKAMMATGYMMPLVAATQTIGGLLLLAGYSVPFALLILAPITINIVFFHLFLTPEPAYLVLPALMVIMHIVIATAYWPAFRPLFNRNQKLTQK